ncbi:uncharacterized protein LOC130140091 [Syzygium oleosum]|uniref:uncharacterized protein LOC130140091 n=1 Tax=Syzygium oleosum TaxID=219896 RepID=UPI0024B91FA5|nr:uncharacterized protein LOC130140091 [Syzygium oleosum]
MISPWLLSLLQVLKARLFSPMSLPFMMPTWLLIFLGRVTASPFLFLRAYHSVLLQLSRLSMMRLDLHRPNCPLSLVGIIKNQSDRAVDVVRQASPIRTPVLLIPAPGQGTREASPSDRVFDLESPPTGLSDGAGSATVEAQGPPSVSVPTNNSVFSSTEVRRRPLPRFDNQDQKLALKILMVLMVGLNWY